MTNHSLNAPSVFLPLQGTFLRAVNPPFNFFPIFEGIQEKEFFTYRYISLNLYWSAQQCQEGEKGVTF